MIDNGSPVDPANREPGFYNGPLEVFHLLRPVRADFHLGAGISPDAGYMYAIDSVRPAKSDQQIQLAVKEQSIYIVSRRTDPMLAPDLVDRNATVGFLQYPNNLAFRKS